MKTKTLLLSMTAALALGAVPPSAWATAITYTGNEAFGGATIHLAITTDGVVGALQSNDIKKFDIRITDEFGSSDINSTDGYGSVVFFEEGNDAYDDGGLTATPSQLSFNFAGKCCGNSGVDVYGIEFYDNLSDGLFCLQSNGCLDFNGAEIIASSVYSSNSGDFESLAESGEVVIANAAGVSAAPEPSTWELLITGVGLCGFALRLGRRCSPAMA